MGQAEMEVVEAAWQRAKKRAQESAQCAAHGGIVEMLDLQHDEMRVIHNKLDAIPAEVASAVARASPPPLPFAVQYGKTKLTLAALKYLGALIFAAWVMARINHWPLPDFLGAAKNDVAQGTRQ